MCFPVNFAKSLRTLFYRTLGECFCKTFANGCFCIFGNYFVRTSSHPNLAKGTFDKTKTKDRSDQ